MAETIIRLGPQPGPQTKFLATPADIAVYGGAAGGGKTFALLLDPLRHVHNPRFNAVLFRRKNDDIRQAGGLWDASKEVYGLLDAKPRELPLDWRFRSGAYIKFDSMQFERDKENFQGAELAGIGFDELTHFTESQFFYLLSRNRSTCGVRPYVRATTNPDANSWVKKFLAPWVDGDFRNPAASGEIRWFVRDGGEIKWVDRATPFAKSVTFVKASLADNRILEEKDPAYRANLMAMSVVDRNRLLDGDWNIVEGGNMFRAEWFRVTYTPPECVRWVRYWDLAASEPKNGSDPDYTVGVLMGRTKDGEYVVADVKRERTTPLQVEKLVLQTAQQDGQRVAVRMEQEPGSSGKTVVDRYLRLLAGFDFKGIKSSGDKAERAKPFSAMAEAGHVHLLSAPWNSAYLAELTAFPTKGVHDDQADGSSGAFNAVVKDKPVIEFF